MAHILRSATPALLILVLSIYKDLWVRMIRTYVCDQRVSFFQYIYLRFCMSIYGFAWHTATLQKKYF